MHVLLKPFLSFCVPPQVLGYNIGCDISPDGSYIISGSADGKATVYDQRRAGFVKKLDIGGQDPCVDVAWHPLINSVVAGATWGGRIALWQ